MARAVAVQTRTFGGLNLENVERMGLWGGGSHNLEIAALIAEDDARGIRLEQRNAAFGEGMQEVDGVEVGDQGIGEFDEGVGEDLFAFPLSARRSTPRFAATDCCSD